MVNRLSANDARNLTMTSNMKDKLLKKAYLSIEDRAKEGKRRVEVYVDNFEMGDVKNVMNTLTKDGYHVRLRNVGFIIKEIDYISHILVEW